MGLRSTKGSAVRGGIPTKERRLKGAEVLSPLLQSHPLAIAMLDPYLEIQQTQSAAGCLR